MTVAFIIAIYLLLLVASLVFIYCAGEVSVRPDDDRWLEESLVPRPWRKAS
jgi:hypothetical protein